LVLDLWKIINNRSRQFIIHPRKESFRILLKMLDLSYNSKITDQFQTKFKEKEVRLLILIIIGMNLKKLKENIFVMSLISFIHYMTSSIIYCSIPNELIQFEVLPYIDKTLYGKLVLVNKDFYYCCFNGTINFIVKVKPELKELQKWGKTKIMLKLYLSSNSKITDNGE
jgi:hypothetical protein